MMWLWMKAKYNDNNAPLEKYDFDLISALIPNVHLCLMKAMWSENLRLQSSLMPKKDTQLESGMIWPSKVKSGLLGSILCTFLKIMNVVLLGLMINWFETHHSTIRSSSLFSLETKVGRDLLYSEMVVSSAYRTHCAELRRDGKSLI